MARCSLFVLKVPLNPNQPTVKLVLPSGDLH